MVHLSRDDLERTLLGPLSETVDGTQSGHHRTPLSLTEANAPSGMSVTGGQIVWQDSILGLPRPPAESAGDG